MYNNLKKYKDKIYTGMKVGGTHSWNYNDGKWNETKLSPEMWKINFESIKTRIRPAPENTGAKVGTEYHWYILADQIALKLDANTYSTSMNGIKFKMGHKRPHWRVFSYEYPEQESYKEKLIRILEKTLNDLKGDKLQI